MKGRPIDRESEIQRYLETERKIEMHSDIYTEIQGDRDTERQVDR